MERDERGREVRHRPPPGRRAPDLDEGAWPALEHNHYTFEGRIEQLGALGRGMSRHNIEWRRVVGLFVALAMLAPILIGTVWIAAEVLGD